MNTRLINKRDLLKAFPGTFILALGFLMPFVWWPTERVTLALLLYAPLLVILLAGGCFLSSLEKTAPSYFLKGTATIIGVFISFVIFVVAYRAFFL